jgi:hypothetical protein
MHLLILEKLDDGDVAHSIDFRSIYATLLDKWLGADEYRKYWGGSLISLTSSEVGRIHTYCYSDTFLVSL